MFFNCCGPRGTTDRSSLPSTVIQNGTRDADAPWVSQSFNSCCDIHTVAINIFTIHDDIADIDANAKANTALFGAFLLRHCKRVLYVDRKTDRIDDTGELDQASVAHQLNSPTSVSFDPWIDFGTSECFQRRQGATLVLAHEFGVAHDVSRKDRCQFALLAANFHFGASS